MLKEKKNKSLLDTLKTPKSLIGKKIDVMKILNEVRYGK